MMSARQTVWSALIERPSKFWTRITVGFMFVWVLMTLLEETGVFKTSVVVDNIRTWKIDTRIDNDTKTGLVEESDPDSVFTYKHTVLDDLAQDLVEDALIGDLNMATISLQQAQNINRNISTLPRTSSVTYNQLEQGEKYLLYSPSGGFNNQLICFVNAVTLAMRTNRALIVPMNGKHANLYTGYLRLMQHQLVPMDQTLDFDHIQKYTGVKLVPINVTMNEFVSKWISREKLKTIHLPGSGLLRPLDTSVYGTVYHKLKVSGKQVVWLRGRFFTAHWLRHDIWRNSRYAPFLQKIARVVSQQVFNENYNAFHIRMGDYAKTALRHASDASGFLKNAIGLGYPKDVPVYIASDYDRSHPYFKPILDYFDKVVFQEDLADFADVRDLLVEFTLRTPHKDVRNDLFGLVEQLICTRANMYVGTHVSTFSRTIRLLRQNIRASIPDLYQSLIEKREQNEQLPNRVSAFHRWKGGPPLSYQDNIDYVEEESKKK